MLAPRMPVARNMANSGLLAERRCLTGRLVGFHEDSDNVVMYDFTMCVCVMVIDGIDTDRDLVITRKHLKHWKHLQHPVILSGVGLAARLQLPTA